MSGSRFFGPGSAAKVFLFFFVLFFFFFVGLQIILEDRQGVFLLIGTKVKRVNFWDCPRNTCLQHFSHKALGYFFHLNAGAPWVVGLFQLLISMKLSVQHVVHVFVQNKR